MKTIKYIIAFFILMAHQSPNFIHAQTNTTTDRNVTVEREYKPVIQDAGKISSVPEVLEPTIIKPVATYSSFNMPLSVNENIQTLSPAELENNRRANDRAAFFRIGMGNNLNNAADFSLPIISKEDVLLDLKLNHLAKFGKKAHSTTNAALTFDKYYKRMNLYSGLGLGHESLLFYGNNYNYDRAIADIDALGTSYGSIWLKEQDLGRMKDSTELLNIGKKNNDYFWRGNVFIGIKSLAKSTELIYNAQLNYKFFNSHNGLSENIFDTKIGFNTQNKKNRLGIDVELMNIWYRPNKNDASLNIRDSYSVFVLNPYYSIDRTRWNVRMGVKSSFSFRSGRAFNPSPDINAEIRIIPKIVALYAGIGGDYKVNTMDETFSENRYSYADLRIQDTYTPFNFYAGIKLKPIYNLLFDAYLSYKRIDNQYFFVNKEYSNTTISSPDSVIYSNRFNAIYSGANLLKIGLRANYNIFNLLNVEFKGAYNGWSVDTELYAWNKPAWEASLSSDIKLTRNINLSANVFYEGERFARFGSNPLNAMRMSPIVDINLGASYSYSHWFTAFAKVNNLLNSNDQHYYGYEVQGLNMLVGAAFSW